MIFLIFFYYHLLSMSCKVLLWFYHIPTLSIVWAAILTETPINYCFFYIHFMLQHFFLNWKVHIRIPVPSSITPHVCKERTIVLIVEYCNDWKQSELEALHSHSSFRRILTTDNKTIALVDVWAAFFVFATSFSSLVYVTYNRVFSINKFLITTVT